MATVYELRDAYLHPNSGDPVFNAQPATTEELEAHFKGFIKNPTIEEEFDYAEFQGPLTDEQLIKIGRTLVNCYQYDRSEYFGE